MERAERLWLLLMRLTQGDVTVTNVHDRALINGLIAKGLVRQYAAGHKLVYRLTDAGRDYLRRLGGRHVQ